MKKKTQNTDVHDMHEIINEIILECLSLQENIYKTNRFARIGERMRFRIINLKKAFKNFEKLTMEILK